MNFTDSEIAELNKKYNWGLLFTDKVFNEISDWLREHDKRLIEKIEKQRKEIEVTDDFTAGHFQANSEFRQILESFF